jgi:hypothetical protein
MLASREVFVEQIIYRHLKKVSHELKRLNSRLGSTLFVRPDYGTVNAYTLRQFRLRKASFLSQKTNIFTQQHRSKTFR